MPIGAISAYPTMLTITNLVRSIVADDMRGGTDTLGEGQIFVDSLAISVTMGNFFNSAARELQRRLRLSGAPFLIRDNVILPNVPPVNSSLGVATSNPAIQTRLGFDGYFDGLLVNSSISLPGDCLSVLAVWERTAQSNGYFRELGQPANGLAGKSQGQYDHVCEYREDALWFPGSLLARDLRLRYQGRLLDQYQSGVDLSSTYFPILNSEEAMANLIAKRIGTRQGSDMLPQITQDAEAAVLQLCQQQTKAQQGVEYAVTVFGEE